MKNTMVTVASLALLAGCARQTVVASPESLPAIAQTQTVTYARTRDGRPVVEQGPVRWVVVTSGPSAPDPEGGEQSPLHVEAFRAPFQVTFAGDQIQLWDEDRQSRLALRDIQRVEVHYDASVGSPASAMRIAGIVMTSIGSAALVAGVAVMPAFPGGCQCAWLWIGVPLVATSGVFAGVGIPLWIEGARRGGAGATSTPATVPALAPTRNGAALRWTF